LQTVGGSAHGLNYPSENTTYFKTKVIYSNLKIQPLKLLSEKTPKKSTEILSSHMCMSAKFSTSKDNKLQV